MWEARRKDIASVSSTSNLGLCGGFQDGNEEEQMDPGDYPVGFSDHINVSSWGRLFSFKNCSDCFYLRQPGNHGQR